MRSQQLIATYFHDVKDQCASGNTFRVRVDTHQLSGIIKKLYEEEGLPLMTMYATHALQAQHAFTVNYVFGIPGEDRYIILFIEMDEGELFPSFAATYMEFAGYEAEIATMFGIIPDGHPLLRSTALHPNCRKGLSASERFCMGYTAGNAR